MRGMIDVWCFLQDILLTTEFWVLCLILSCLVAFGMILLCIFKLDALPMYLRAPLEPFLDLKSVAHCTQ